MFSLKIICVGDDWTKHDPTFPSDIQCLIITREIQSLFRFGNEFNCHRSSDLIQLLAWPDCQRLVSASMSLAD